MTTSKKKKITMTNCHWALLLVGSTLFIMFDPFDYLPEFLGGNPEKPAQQQKVGGKPSYTPLIKQKEQAKTVEPLPETVKGTVVDYKPKDTTYEWAKPVWEELNAVGFNDKETQNILYNIMAESGGKMVDEKGNKSTYKGRGYIQLTGKKNYEYFGNKLGVDLVNKPELANDPVIAAKIAAQFFKDNKAWRKIKNYETPEMVIKALAPANANWADRQAWLEKNKIRPPALTDKPVKPVKK